MSIDLARAYLVERYPSRTFVPLAAVLAATGLAIARPASAGRAAAALLPGFVIAYCLVLAFRLWDDLEDRDRDAVEHPERVLVRATTRAPFAILLVAMFGAGAAVVASGLEPVHRLVVLALGAVALFAWYRVRRLASRSVVGAPLILAKYPLVAYVSARAPASASSLRFTLAVLLPIYLALLTYELVDDARSRGPAT